MNYKLNGKMIQSMVKKETRKLHASMYVVESRPFVHERCILEPFCFRLS